VLRECFPGPEMQVGLHLLYLDALQRAMTYFPERLQKKLRAN
jgi:hypothetical protein